MFFSPHYFKNCKVSALALLKMVMHARSGGNLEVMGMMLGKVLINKVVCWLFEEYIHSFPYLLFLFRETHGNNSPRTWNTRWSTCFFFWSFFGHRPKCSWTDRKEFSHLGQNGWKYSLMNTVTASSNTTVRQMIEMFQWPICLSEKKQWSTPILGSSAGCTPIRDQRSLGKVNGSDMVKEMYSKLKTSAMFSQAFEIYERKNFCRVTDSS